MNGGTFCQLFGGTPRNQILEFFLEMRGIDFSRGDVAQELGLSRATVYVTLDELVRGNLLIPTRAVSGVQLYTLNTKNVQARLLMNVFALVLERVVEKHRRRNVSISSRKIGR